MVPHNEQGASVLEAKPTHRHLSRLTATPAASAKGFLERNLGLIATQIAKNEDGPLAAR